MKKYINILTILLLISSLSVSAQVNNKEIPIEIVYFDHLDDNVYLTLEVDLRYISLPSNESLRFSPVISDNTGNLVRLKSILINGTNRHKVFMRDANINKKHRQIRDEYQAVIKLDQASRKATRYTATIPFESWMDDAILNVSTDICGCAGKAFNTGNNLTAKLNTEEPEVVETAMEIAYIRPDVETVKQRNESQDVFLDFPVAKTDIITSFGNNPRELPKIEKFIREIHEDKNLNVTRIGITGYASPEGDEAFNNRLSQGRAEALRNYLSMRTSIPHNLYQVGYGGEDWKGLAKLVEESYIEQKENILSIINFTYDPAERKRQIKSLGGGYIYKRLLNEYYPRLRRVLATMDYNVRGFDVNEAKEIYKTRPHQLSLEEMFMVANTYPKYTAEFTDIFETAVRMFPNDPVANHNAAATALAGKNLEKARKYLEKADSTTAAYLNNLGIYYWINGNMEQAKKLLTQASQKGSVEATNNIKKIIY